LRGPARRRRVGATGREERGEHHEDRRGARRGRRHLVPPGPGCYHRPPMPTRTERATADALAAYAAHLRAERHASPHTVRGYLADLRQFLAFVGAGGPAAVRIETIRHWLRTLDGRTDRNSIARKLAAVRGLFRFLVDTQRLAHDPSAVVATPKTARKLPAHLTLDDVDRLFSSPRADRLLGLRDPAILELPYSWVLRVSELTGLDWEHLDDAALHPRRPPPSHGGL